MIEKARMEAENFLNNEKQFHLGVLPTEQSNPKTRDLDKKFVSDPGEGVEMLLNVDRDVQKTARKILEAEEFREMVDAGSEAIFTGHKIVFSGCGSTGRLSILLESMWRRFFKDLKCRFPEIFEKISSFGNSVCSIMTGGDYALIRSVEYFEDYQIFGKQQVKEIDITKGDVLIAITEGGETSSVLGTVEESADRGARVFLLFNNPAEILLKYIERSAKAIRDPRVTVLDLYCGPMAIAGSTRMQATTSELLIAGAALETILKRLLLKHLTLGELKKLKINDTDYVNAFKDLLDDLLNPVNTKTLAEYINLEERIYNNKGLVTYFANEFLLDIFTDTTERAPTFMLPPFKKFDDHISPPSWAFVKNPLLSTPRAWENMLGRAPRCLNWGRDLYLSMGVPESFAANPPLIDNTQLMKFIIGYEKDRSRLSGTPNLAVSFTGSRELKFEANKEYYNALKKCTSGFRHRTSLIIGNGPENAVFRIYCSPEASVMNLMEHLAAKLVLNTISTGTMVLMGRVTGNWMSWVDVSNKKLKDRGIRLISEICGLSYEDSCYKLHETLEEFRSKDNSGEESLSPVQYAIKKIREE